MKALIKYILLLGLVTAALAQYGIPDDDDDLPPAPPVRETFVPRLQTTAAPVVSSYTKYEEIEPIVMPGMSPAPIDLRREQPATVYTAPVVKTVVQPTRFQIREERIEFKQPVLFAVRTTEKPILVQYPASVERTSVVSSSPPVAPIQIRLSDDYSTPVKSVRDYSSHEVRSAEVVPIVKYVMDNDHRGTFRSETITGDGTSKIMNGHLKDLGGSEGPVVVKSGSYRYTGDDGKVYSVDWKADEGGFQAFGDHLPTTPSPLH